MKQTSFFLLGLLWVIPLSSLAQVVNLDLTARVKEHRRGAEGNLVAGEEHMRKLLLQWDAVDGALGYQVCHNCQPAEDGNLEGSMIDVPPDMRKADRPVFIFPNAPIGKNTFHVRASVKENEWGPWTDQRSFFVDEPGEVEHIHEEL